MTPSLTYANHGFEAPVSSRWRVALAAFLLPVALPVVALAMLRGRR